MKEMPSLYSGTLGQMKRMYNVAEPMEQEGSLGSSEANSSASPPTTSVELDGVGGGLQKIVLVSGSLSRGTRETWKIHLEC